MESLQILLALIAEGVGVAKQISSLAIRVQAGETITNEEINQARREILAAETRWENAADHDKEND